MSALPPGHAGGPQAIRTGRRPGGSRHGNGHRPGARLAPEEPKFNLNDTRLHRLFGCSAQRGIASSSGTSATGFGPTDRTGSGERRHKNRRISL